MNFKQIILISCVLTSLTGNLFAQEADGRFLLRDGKAKLTTFYAEVNPGTSFSSLNGQMVSIGEINAGLILNNSFSISFFMTGSPKINTVAIPAQGSQEWDDWVEAGVELDKVSSDAEFLYVKFKHSGLRFGYLHNTEKSVFWRTGLGIGFLGGLNMTEDQTFMGLFDNKVWESSILTLEPQFGGGVNLLPWWRAYLDVGYRLMRVDENLLKSTSTDSFTLKLGFAFGNFRNK